MISKIIREIVSLENYLEENKTIVFYNLVLSLQLLFNLRFESENNQVMKNMKNNTCINRKYSSSKINLFFNFFFIQIFVHKHTS